MTTKDTKPPEKQSVNIKSDKMRKGKISTKHQKKPQITLKMAKLHEMDKKGLQKEKKDHLMTKSDDFKTKITRTDGHRKQNTRNKSQLTEDFFRPMAILICGDC